MISPGLVYLVLTAALFAVAAVTHFHIKTLSVPIPSPLTIITAILPIIALVNAYIRPNLLLSAQQHSRPSPWCHLPTALQTVQALLAAVLATVLLQSAGANRLLVRCALEDRWMSMFRAKDAKNIRAIQDVLECCGFNSVRDRAYPFGQPSACAETYGRTQSCAQAWKGAMQTSAGIDFGVVLAVAILQVIGLLMMKEGASWWTAWRTWSGRAAGGSSTTERLSRRPLLEAPIEEDEEEEIGTERDEQQGYGTANSGAPRVIPSSMGGERNEWDE